ncbi:MAG TPA: hypothetical protein VHJ76_08050 [Actinomycetota bacterium]|nr:hypothetical protein [Actinomycetota bacterium]
MLRHMGRTQGGRTRAEGSWERRRALVITCLLLGSATPAVATAAPPRLAGQTVIAAARPGSMAISLPAPARVATPFGASDDVSVRGGGNLVVFALVERDEDPFVLLGGRLPRASGAQTFALPLSNLPERSGWSYDFVKNYEDETVVPPGDYTLYVFPDGKPAQITLRLDGLSGKTSVAPRGPADFTVSTPDPRLTAGKTKNLYSAGAAHVLENQGLMFNALWLHTDPFVAGQFEFCHYEGQNPAEPVEYGPGCPNAKQSATLNNRQADMEPSTQLLYGGKSALPPTRHGQGFWYATEGVVTDVGYVSMWLSYE